MLLFLTFKNLPFLFRTPDEPCSGEISLPFGFVSKCKQKFIKKKLLALDADGQGTSAENFFIPSCCVCHVTRTNQRRWLLRNCISLRYYTKRWHVHDIQKVQIVIWNLEKKALSKSFFHLWKIISSSEHNQKFIGQISSSKFMCWMIYIYIYLIAQIITIYLIK